MDGGRIGEVGEGMDAERGIEGDSLIDTCVAHVGCVSCLHSV